MLLISQNDVLEVARQLCAIAVKKHFMSEMCAVAIGDLVENSHFRGNKGSEVRLEIVRESGVEEGWAGCTPERLYLVLRLDKLLRSESWWAELIRDNWVSQDSETGSIITGSRLDSIASILEVRGEPYRFNGNWMM